MKAYLIGEKDYDMCTHNFLTLDEARAQTKLKEMNERWAEEHKPRYIDEHFGVCGETMRDKDGNITGPYDIEEIELDVELE